ncbi:MAG: signal peptidase II [Paraglaciecola sp.]|uniref:signal peptidase II n=1 Tax=Pseudomonadati TaxID=3379134 RepID=UPI00273FC605|nr:signal peptidase II [Paraglaciecola sp.]MDP5031466.1 signal peptidase II [Paraglaciecola sp.]MDP5130811.1 signal peptidase II [Paraglaciecola sp.]
MLKLLSQTGWRFLWLSLLVFVLDQYTKGLIVEHIELYQAIQITSFFNLTHVYNYGAAFSFLHDAGGWQRWFFTAIALGVVVLMMWWLKQLSRSHILLPLAFCLIIGGALGNAYDRLVLGHVVDFLVVYYQEWVWPAFNVADSAICVGAALMIVDMVKNKEQKND